MKHVSDAESHVEALTGLTRGEAGLIAGAVSPLEFWDEPSAEALRRFLHASLNDEMQFAVACSDANAEDVRRRTAGSVDASDELFERPYDLADLLEKVDVLSDDKVHALFGFLLGRHRD